MHNEVRQFFNKKANEWDTFERREQSWLDDFIRQYVPVEEGMKVLDLGCGTGIITRILFNMSKAKVTALDVSENMIELAKQKHHEENIEFYAEDFYKTEQSSFDMIVCFNAYPHFVDIHRFEQKTVDILNEQGYLVILHNMSREALSKCHSGLSHKISRNLEPVSQELKHYQQNFNVIETIDNNNMFMMLLQKKKR